MPLRALLAAGMVALAAAGCASQGTVSAQTGPGATGSAALASAFGPASSAASASSTDTGSVSGSPSGSASTSDQDSSSVTSSDTDSPAAPASTSGPTTNAPMYKLTDTVTEGGFKLKINSIQLPWNPPAGSQFTPAPARAWLLMDFQVTNVSGQQSMFDTIGAFDLRDNTNASHLTSIVPGDTLPAAKKFEDQEVAPGATVGGEVVFDVPANGAPFRLIFSGNMWHASQTPPVISLSK
ncbi:DUF4352 domain-containing protein [Catenulispora sp. NF23]|uniref:DUF4352 domain-containing protein n=1 Tax=Catenulispora pinistramenti TaxID=2705254 RepID=UPI001BA4852A|nr:DUF4352 domain-containing protein [Catenulispora pinistramenti]MBS2540047.1 DUF4352 domain-containing protein [Catenulispora pinistramenti]